MMLPKYNHFIDLWRNLSAVFMQMRSQFCGINTSFNERINYHSVLANVLSPTNAMNSILFTILFACLAGLVSVSKMEFDRGVASKNSVFIPHRLTRLLIWSKNFNKFICPVQPEHCSIQSELNIWSTSILLLLRRYRIMTASRNVFSKASERLHQPGWTIIKFWH